MDAGRSTRDLAQALGISHPWVANHAKNPRKSLGPKTLERVVERIFDGDMERFVETALGESGNHVHGEPRTEPRITIRAQKPAERAPRRYQATHRHRASKRALDAAIGILMNERGIAKKKSILDVEPFVYFDSEDHADNVLEVTNALELAVKGDATRGGGKWNDRDPGRWPRR